MKIALLQPHMRLLHVKIALFGPHIMLLHLKIALLGQMADLGHATQDRHLQAKFYHANNSRNVTFISENASFTR